VTALYYVNGAAPDQAPWDSDRDGGALLVWAHAHAAGPNAHAANEAAMVARYGSDAPPVEVSPDADVLVLFNSYLEHEVLPCRCVCLLTTPTTTTQLLLLRAIMCSHCLTSSTTASC